MRFQKKLRVPDQKQVFNYAVWLLARSNYTRQGLLEKFSKRFLPDAEIFSSTLEKLVRLGFQSDQSFAEAFVRTHPSLGSRRIKIELTRKGVAPEIIAEILSNADDAEHCQTVLQRKLKNGVIPKDYKAKQKLAAFLARRGFDFETIKKSLGL